MFEAAMCVRWTFSARQTGPIPETRNFCEGLQWLPKDRLKLFEKALKRGYPQGPNYLYVALCWLQNEILGHYRGRLKKLHHFDFMLRFDPTGHCTGGET